MGRLEQTRSVLNNRARGSRFFDRWNDRNGIAFSINESGTVVGASGNCAAYNPQALRSLQPVHARRRYTHGDVLWGARHADILSELPDGTLLLDLRKFHDTIPTPATEDFPYGLGPNARRTSGE